MTWDAVAVARTSEPERKRQIAAFVAFLARPEIQSLLTYQGRALPARRDALDGLAPQEAAALAPFEAALPYSRLQTPLRFMDRFDRALNAHFRSLLDAVDPADPSRVIADMAQDPDIRGALSGSVDQS